MYIRSNDLKMFILDYRDQLIQDIQRLIYNFGMVRTVTLDIILIREQLPGLKYSIEMLCMYNNVSSEDLGKLGLFTEQYLKHLDYFETKVKK